MSRSANAIGSQFDHTQNVCNNGMPMKSAAGTSIYGYWPANDNWVERSNARPVVVTRRRA